MGAGTGAWVGWLCGGAIPLWLKLLYTVFMAVLVPYYWSTYGPLNFLWFCDVALLLTLAALWLESPLLASMPAVAIVLPQLLWVFDFFYRMVTGSHPGIDLTEYMFDPDRPLFVRGLSLFHGWLPFLLLWMVWRLGYDWRALPWQTLVCWVVLLMSSVLVRENNPKGAGNVNKIFGWNDDATEPAMAPLLWLSILMVGYPLLVYVPTHFLLWWLIPARDGHPG